MKKIMLLFIVSIICSCSGIENDKFVGTWECDQEECYIQSIIITKKDEKYYINLDFDNFIGTFDKEAGGIFSDDGAIKFDGISSLIYNKDLDKIMLYKYTKLNSKWYTTMDIYFRR